jgi:hypothetical protein
MPDGLPRLLAHAADRVDVQDTAFAYDVLGRFVCNTWDEAEASTQGGSNPFGAVVVGAGMFGGHLAARLYRAGAHRRLRILVLDAGALLFAEHIQNLPQRLGGPVAGPTSCGPGTWAERRTSSGACPG